jgi:DNA-binding transcriptional ArsR family regulator
MQSTKADKPLTIEILELRKAALVLRAINHPLRQQMLQLLHKHKRMPVTDLYVKLRIEQSVASQQLAILRKASFVNTQREGKQVFYSVNYGRLGYVTKQAQELIQGY